MTEDNIETKVKDQQEQKEQQEVVEVKKDEEQSPDIKSEENQINWKKFREERERERKQRIEAEKEAQRRREEAEALKAALESVVNKPDQRQSNYYPENDIEETEEQRIEKHVKAAIEKERQRNEEERRKQEAQDLPNRINRELKDFNQVVTTENVDYLEYHHPEIASAFKYMPESYEKWSSVYKAVKKLVPNMNSEKDIKRMQENLSKPQAQAATIPSKAPEQSSWKLTEERRMANWRRMQEDAKSF